MSTRPDAVLVGDLHLDAAIHGLRAGTHHRSARLLIWLHGAPLGEIDVECVDGHISAERLRAAAWTELHDAILSHLDGDGLPRPDDLGVAGLAGVPDPACAREYDSARRWPLTVVVATRDRPESLRRTLESLAALDHERFDVVVVDSAPSDDRTRQLLQGDAEWPWRLRYVRVSRPGLAVAHNAALPWVTGDAVAFTDDDVVVDRRWLTALAVGFTDPDVQCVTGLLVPAELETPAQLWVEQGGGYGRGYTARHYSLRQPDDNRLFPFAAGRFGSGANMAFRTDWLRRTGGFDPVTGAGTIARGGDDLIAFARVVLDGGTLAYQPGAVVRHWHRREYAGLRRQALGYGMGLGAYLASTLWRDPSLLGPMVRRAGPALTHVLSPGSEKNADKRDYPQELTRRERVGMVMGPFAYAAGRWRAHRDETADLSPVP